MPSIGDTKAQLLRGIVEDNLDVVQGGRTQRVARRRARVKISLWIGIIGLAVGYLSVSTQGVSRDGAPINAAARDPAVVPISTETVPETEAPLGTPRPIDRNAIPLTVKTVVIDPGHGGDPGAIAESGLAEKDITLDIALRLRRLLQEAPFEILLTRDTDRRLSLDRRVQFANENKADLFLSIHVNSMEPRTIRALETYYVGPTDDPHALNLASRENKESGYSLSDYKQILEKIYVDARRDESHSAARTLHSQLFRALKQDNPQLENRGVRTAPFVVLIGTQMPAVLMEIACLSNPEEVELLTNQQYRENIALALAQGIRRYASSLTVADRKGS
ncbi:MAG TPA: N-acetylmuramoyl-L-alanine amidase [Candidatus Binatia bacterium]|jgi:N-acetylmuramoyl-L-alanine amidase